MFVYKKIVLEITTKIFPTPKNYWILLARIRIWYFKKYKKYTKRLSNIFYAFYLLKILVVYGGCGGFYTVPSRAAQASRTFIQNQNKFKEN